MVEGAEFEVIGLDAQGRGNMILDQAEPLHLFIGKVYRARVAAQRPLHEVIIHPVGKGREAVRIAHLKADDRDQVGELRCRAALDFFGLFDRVAIPEPLDGDALLLELVVQLFEGDDHHGAILVGFVIDDPQGDDLVLVFFDKLTEGMDHSVGVFFTLAVKADKSNGIDIGRVDDLVVTAADVLDIFAYFGMLERLDRLTDHLALCRLYLFIGRSRGTVRGMCAAEDHILVKGVQQVFRNHARAAADTLGKLSALGIIHLTVQTDDAVGKRGEGIFVAGAESDIVHQLAHRYRRLALEGACLGFLGFGDAYRVNDHKMIFVLGCGWRDLLQIVLIQRARAAAFHLLIIILTADVAHEDQALDGFDVGAGRDHIDGNGNTRIVVVAERTENGLGVLGVIGDLFAEFVTLAEFLADGVNDIVGMAVGLGEDQRLGDFFAAREQRCK